MNQKQKHTLPNWLVSVSGVVVGIAIYQIVKSMFF